jgi:hypothetical protein
MPRVGFEPTTPVFEWAKTDQGTSESCGISAADVNEPWHLTELKMFKIEKNCKEAIASQVNSSAAICLVSTGVAYCRRMYI